MNTASFTLTHAGGAAFSLASLLALEGRNTNTGFFRFSALAIDMTGTFVAGGSISTTLALDLIALENAAIDSQLFTFTGWTGLSSITFTGVGGPANGYSFALDDVVVSSVPKPWLTVSELPRDR